jgi:peptidoglycan/xylan/chitin deacetylase (PgdA/CDA1 family)
MNDIKSQYHLPVLMYHRIVKKRSEAGRHNIYVTLKRFRAQLTYLKEQGFQTITFRDVNKSADHISATKNVILTFDDGYLDNYKFLFPLLKEFGFTAVIFLVTKQKQNAWGIREGEPALDLMNSDQVREMDQYGIEFGGHTQNHPDLLLCNKDQLKEEIAGCKKDIESLLNREVISFAYPFGGLNQEIKQEVKRAGYLYGISTNTGPYNFSDDLFQIRRIEVSSKTLLYSFKRKVSGYYFKPSFLSYFSSK